MTEKLCESIGYIKYSLCDECSLVFHKQQIEAPINSSLHSCWIQQLYKWRENQLKQINYNEFNYNRPELKWAQSNPIQPQLMAHDRQFYDPIAHKYTVDKYVKQLKERYGGIDSVLIWPTYPNIGIDNRNTDDLIRDMAGGLNSIRQMIAQFHSYGIKVLFPIHPWDIGTRNAGQQWSVILPQTMLELNADGLNGDTMEGINKEYFENSLALNHSLVLEPELGISNASLKFIEWNVNSWGESYNDGWNYESFRPMISKYKWLERRHQTHVCDRWSKSKISLLQSAFFNGVGMETWENVFGVWNQITDRDCMAIKMVSEILRQFSQIFISDNWIPYFNTVNDSVVFASEWRSDNITVWTLINRSGDNITGPQINVSHTNNELNYYDLWHGIQIFPELNGNNALISISIEANGFGAIMSATPNDLTQNFQQFLSNMQEYSTKSLSYYSSKNIVLNQTITHINKTKLYENAPNGMILIPDCDNYTFVVSGTEIEGGDHPGVDVQYPWEQFPSRNHKHIINIKNFYIDITPVTNLYFQKFVNITGYKPEDDHNFVRDWSNGEYPNGWDNKPVTWVSLEDAREYCEWNGKRLPNEWEWQYSAQTNDDRNYPWGQQFDQNRVPIPNTSRNITEPNDVNAHINGASIFGVLDLVGNVWQWTNEYSDDHTRFAVLRGGSYYQPLGSDWYFPNGQQNYKLTKHNKYLLMSGSLDRSAVIGFRCAADSD